MTSSTNAVARAAPAAPSLTKNRPFMMILIGNTISQLGDGFHSVALGLWILQSTGSASAMSAVVSVRIIMGILLGAVGGTMADRSDRWRLMWVCDFLRGLSVFGIAWLVAQPSAPFALFLILTGVVSALGQFRGPAFAAALVQLVKKEDLQQARGLMQVTNTSAQILGPLLGGAVVAMVGGWAAMAGDATSFILSGLLVMLAGSFPSPRRETAKGSSFWRDMTEGWSYTRRNPFAFAITILAPVVNFFSNACGILIPVLAIKVWMASPMEFGVIEASIPVGVTLGGALLMAWGKRLQSRRGWVISAAVLGIGPVFVLLGLIDGPLFAIPLMIVFGVVMAVVNILMASGLQAQTDPSMQGRIFGTLGSLQNIATPLSVAVAGPLADFYGASSVIAVAGVAVGLLAPAAIAVLPGLRNYD